MSFELDIGLTTLAGKRAINEDFVAAMLPERGADSMGAIAAIADGVSMGGMGKEAAQTTVTSLVRDYFGTPETWDTTVALDRIIGAQNLWLAGINRRRQPQLGLSTLTALVLRGQSWTLAHVGDTRAYLLRDGQLTQLTQDHVVAHPDFQHQLLRSIGAEDRVSVDYSQGDLLVGDVFVLLSDGVHNVLNDMKIKALAQARAEPSDAQALSVSLVNVALQQGSQDNVTALVVRVKGLREASLRDENRLSQVLPIPPKFKLGEVIDGLVVTAAVADNGINILYQVRAIAPTFVTAGTALPPEGAVPGLKRPGAAAVPAGKLYALKTLHPLRSHDEEERAMLAHEAWLAKRMVSGRGAEHLVLLHEGGLPGHSPSAFYLLYDWHNGETLQQVLDRRQGLSLNQALGAAAQAAKALGGLHRQSVIHRDVKPANLHQGEDGVLRLLDLGVALSGREPSATRHLHAGTPSYINPEQWGFSVRSAGAASSNEPEPPDARSDLFALGVTLYQLLCHGKLPYGEVVPYQSGRYYRDPVAPSRHNPEVPIWLDHVVLKAVARDKRQRFETAEEFLLALDRGAARPLSPLPATPLIQRDPALLYKLGLLLSLLFNALLVFWLMFLPK